MLKVDPRSLPPEQYRKFFCDFIQKYEFDQFIELLLRDAGSEDYVPFFVDSFDLLQFEPTIGFLIINYPKLLLQVFEDALYELQSLTVMNQHVYEKYHKTCTIKKNCKIRIHSLPPIPELNKSTLGQIRSQESESLLQISGTVVRTGTVRMLELSKEYQCMNPKCGFRFKVYADPEQGYMVPQPRICPSSTFEKNRDSNISNQYKCKSVNLRVVEGSRDLVDYQEIKVQDQVDRLEMGNIPRSMNIILEADLVDKYNAGDNIVIVGILMRQWRPVMPGVRCQLDIVMKAISVIILNAKESTSTSKYLTSSDTVDVFGKYWEHYHQHSKPFSGRNHIIRAVCPSLCGLMMVKLSLLLTLIGGGVTSEKGGIRRRSQSHLLIVGDPGTGKSQLLRFAAAVATRSVLTTGIGTSGAGLTCTAIRDGGDWCLEAGALVLANEGLCCIDEFSSIKEQDRASIHEAMEQQTLSVAKAGLVVKLNTRTTVIAVANPKGSYDVTADLSANTAIATPLLSRFDLILVLLDSPLKSWDIKMSTFLLQQAVKEGGSSESTKDTSNLRSRSSQQSQTVSEMIESLWSIEKLREYISTVKSHIQPTMSLPAQCLLMRYYQQQRQSSERSVSRTTIRLLESLVRLSEAHAKLMYQQEVKLSDAIVAIGLMELSMNSISLLDPNSPLHADFPVDAEKEMEEWETKIMAKLNYSKRAMEIDIAAKSESSSSKNLSYVNTNQDTTTKNSSVVTLDQRVPFQEGEPFDDDDMMMTMRMMHELPNEVFDVIDINWDNDRSMNKVINDASSQQLATVATTSSSPFSDTSSASLWETCNNNANDSLCPHQPPLPLPLPVHSDRMNVFETDISNLERFSHFSDNYSNTLGGNHIIPDRREYQVPPPHTPHTTATFNQAHSHSSLANDNDDDNDILVHQTMKHRSLPGVCETSHHSYSGDSIRNMKRKYSTVVTTISDSRCDSSKSSFRNNNATHPYPKGIAIRDSSSSSSHSEVPLKAAVNQNDLLVRRVHTSNNKILTSSSSSPQQQYQHQQFQSIHQPILINKQEPTTIANNSQINDDNNSQRVHNHHRQQSKSIHESRLLDDMSDNNINNRNGINKSDNCINKNYYVYNNNNNNEFLINEMLAFPDIISTQNTYLDHQYIRSTETINNNLQENERQPNSYSSNDSQKIRYYSRVGEDTDIHRNEVNLDFIESDHGNLFDCKYNQIGDKNNSNNVIENEKSIINLSVDANIYDINNSTPMATNNNISQVSSSSSSSSSSHIQDILLVDDW